MNVDDLTEEQLQDMYLTYHPVDWAELMIEPTANIKLDAWQKDFLSDKSRRILLNCHRQSGKSTLVAIKALHRALFWDDQLIILVSPVLSQSSELFYKIKTFIKNVPQYRDRVNTNNELSLSFDNGSRIKTLPASNWNIRGSTANLIIIDEAAGVPDEIFEVLSPMLLTTNGQMIVLSTPRGKNGKYYGYYKDDSWKKYEVKVSNNPRMQTPDKEEFLLSELRQKGTRMYGQEYECEFLGNVDGSIFKRGWFNIVDAPFSSDCLRVRFWDIAATAKDIRKGNDPDWLVGVLMSYNQATNRVCIEDVRRIQGTPEEGERLQYDTAMMDGINTKIRDEEQPGAAGKVLTYNYARTIFRGYDYVSRSPSGDKTLRASPFAAACERGDVDILRGAWNIEYLDELCAFPLGRHDDQVDASSGAYTELTQNKASLNVWFI